MVEYALILVMVSVVVIVVLIATGAQIKNGSITGLDIKQGSVRDGGSFAQRICRYSSWNSYFTQSTYQIKRWNDFLSA